MLEYFTSSKQILEVQGLRPFLSKLVRFLFSSDHNAEIKNTIKHYSSEYSIFVDIGAARGSITFDVAKNFLKCICFEPSPKNYQVFISKLKENTFTNIVPYNCALGEKIRKQNFFLSQNNYGDNRFVKTPDEKFDSCEVEVNTLDSICENLGIKEKCIIKIDVQGSELEVMKGALRVLDRDCIIISEFWPWGMYLNNVEPLEYVQFMKSLDYTFFDLHGNPIKEEYIKRMCLLGKNKRHVADDFLIKK